MLKNEGVMAIIIPDGILGNDGNSELRKWILTQCRILAIIDLPKETFMPYTNIKTSIMIVKKGSFEKEYDIFMAISENCGHDARGNTVPGCDFEDIVTSYKKWIIKK
ncbi:SAM-dependent DNA methyltransferase [Dorea formicigenerans]|uniref:SAM-dependent DNA methyltransferase n=2 Tax=Dorea formicigenerans TaxID=39486 RepID=A0A3E5GP83_9FIRM|nr:SAM-dependent DNA methyltransferase [Dorea formicigenerans]